MPMTKLHLKRPNHNSKPQVHFKNIYRNQLTYSRIVISNIWVSWLQNAHIGLECFLCLSPKPMFALVVGLEGHINKLMGITNIYEQLVLLICQCLMYQLIESYGVSKHRDY